MRSERRGELHRHVALVATERDATPSLPATTLEASGFSLLRLSVPARLLIVAVASALLWGAVLWALR
ncbi:MAG: hypothetical protein ACRECM_10400 [Methyloceanibacter sp.]